MGACRSILWQSSLHLCLRFHFLLSFLVSLLLALVVITVTGHWDVKQLLLIVFNKWLGYRIVEVSSALDQIKTSFENGAFQ